MQTKSHTKLNFHRFNKNYIFIAKNLINCYKSDLIVLSYLPKIGFIKQNPLSSLGATERVNRELFSVRFLALRQFGKTRSSRELHIFATQFNRLLHFLHPCFCAGDFNCQHVD